jgi:hypothetical protein
MEQNSTRVGESETQQATMEWLMQSYQAQQNMNAQLLNAITALQQSVNRSQGTTPPVTTSTPEPLPEAAPIQELRRPKHILPKPEYDHEDPALFPQFRGLLYTKVYGVDILACGNTEEERV